ncbi:MAG: hypothetical protein AAFN12_18390 [Cyanobacteria bacterium J06560_2]
MDQIQIQASKLLDLIFAEETGETYQKTLNLTGTILKESAQLIWLTICSVFVFGAWVADTSMKTGNGLRGWIEDQTNPSAAADKKPIAETGKDLLETGKTGAVYLLNQAREQLGLEPTQSLPVKKAQPAKAAPAAATPPASAAPSPSAAPKASSPSAPTASSPVTPSSSQSSSSASGPSSPAPSTPFSGDSTEEISRESDDGGWPPQETD